MMVIFMIFHLNKLQSKHIQTYVDYILHIDLWAAEIQKYSRYGQKQRITGTTDGFLCFATVKQKPTNTFHRSLTQD